MNTQVKENTMKNMQTTDEISDEMDNLELRIARLAIRKYNLQSQRVSKKPLRW
jgi:hypothetical protein